MTRVRTRRLHRSLAEGLTEREWGLDGIFTWIPTTTNRPSYAALQAECHQLQAECHQLQGKTSNVPYLSIIFDLASVGEIAYALVLPWIIGCC
jgi:hypothetical protein